MNAKDFLILVAIRDVQKAVREKSETVKSCTAEILMEALVDARAGVSRPWLSKMVTRRGINIGAQKEV